MLVKLACVMQRLKKFVMINKNGGGGQFLDFMGGDSCYEGGHRAHGGIPPVPSTRKTLLFFKAYYYLSF